MPGALDRFCELTLMLGAGSVNASWHNLAAFRNEVFKRLDVLIVQDQFTVRAETTYPGSENSFTWWSHDYVLESIFSRIEIILNDDYSAAFSFTSF